MRLIAKGRLRLRSLFRRSRVEDELDAELQFHVDRLVEAGVARGLAHDEATRAALLEIGGLERRKEECRDARRVAWIENGARDLRHAARVLRRSPGFTSVAILSLALGVGANTAIFQLLDAIRLRSLPVANPQELANVRIIGGHGGMGLNDGFNSEFTNPMWEAIRDRQEAFSGVFAWSLTGFAIGRGAESQFVAGMWVSGDLFPTLGVIPERGRLFTAADDRRGCAPQSVVISHTFWQGHFGGSDTAIGSTLQMSGRTFEVIGVTPPGFFGLEVGKGFDVALPICVAGAFGDLLDLRHVWWLTVMGRLKPGWTLARASEHLKTISPPLFESTAPQGYANNTAAETYRKFVMRAEPARAGVSRLRETYERSLWMLWAMTGLVLLIACANLANLMLARAVAREREIAVRVAIGASRTRIAMQLLSESLLLAIAGGAIGAALAAFLSRAVIGFLSTQQETINLPVTLDWRVFTFTAATALVTCIVFGLAPAVRSSLIEPGTAVKSGGRSTSGPERFVLRRVLVAGQVTVSLMLLVFALLFVRSLRNLLTADTGFRRD